MGACIVLLAILSGGFLTLCLEGWILMLLVNWVCSLFSIAFSLTFWQGFGICGLLTFVGSFFKSSND